MTLNKYLANFIVTNLNLRTFPKPFFINETNLNHFLLLIYHINSSSYNLFLWFVNIKRSLRIKTREGENPLDKIDDYKFVKPLEKYIEKTLSHFLAYGQVCCNRLPNPLESSSLLHLFIFLQLIPSNSFSSHNNSYFILLLKVIQINHSISVVIKIQFKPMNG